MSMLAARALAISLGARRILDGVDLQLAPGALVGLVGPNGAGKTTLLRAMLGLVRPDRGAVLIDGAPLHAMDARARARLVAYLPQGGEPAWPLAVADLVSLGRLPHGEGRVGRDAGGSAAVARAMEETGIAHLAARSAASLSGGERARALLARVLAGEPRILLADEPVAALDPYHQLAVMELLAARARAGSAVLVVLHDLNLAARFCDRLVMLDSGRVVGDGAPEAVLTEAALARTYGIAATIGRHDGVLTVLPWQRLSDEARGMEGAR